MQVKRKVTIKWKYEPSTFEKINKEVLGSNFRKIGTSRSAINKLLEQYEMLKVLMPSLIGVSPDSRDINWDKEVNNYWNSLTVDVPLGGKVLETGLKFSINDKNRQGYIKELSNKVATAQVKNPFDTDQKLADYVMGYTSNIPNIDEDERWKYGTPISVEDYLLWRYVQNYSHVANKFEDINKSAKIRFYLNTEEDVERAKKAERAVRNKALEIYTKLLTKATNEDLTDILGVLNPNNIVTLVKDKTKEDKQAELMDVIYKKPEEFISVANNKNLKLLATIKKYIAFDIFHRLPNSSIIVDASDHRKILGNTDNEVISFMSNSKNEAQVNEYLTKFKSVAK